MKLFLSLLFIFIATFWATVSGLPTSVIIMVAMASIIFTDFVEREFDE